MNPTEPSPNTGLRRRQFFALPMAGAIGTIGTIGATAGAAAWAQPATPAPVSIGGTGSGMAPLRRLLEARVASGVNYLPNMGSSGGLKAVAAGALDIAVSARALNEAERAAGLVARPFFRTPLAWAVHPSVPLSNISHPELVQIYRGKLVQWSDGQPVRLVLRPESDSDTLLIRSIGADMAEAVAAALARPGMKVAVTDDEAAADVERIPGALGTVALGLSLAQSRKLRLLSVDGVLPSVAALAGGRPPLHKRIFLVTRGQPAPAVAAVLETAFSSESARMLLALGCAPGGAA